MSEEVELNNESLQRLYQDALAAQQESEAARNDLEIRLAALEEQRILVHERLAIIQKEYDLVRSTKGWKLLSKYREIRDSIPFLSTRSNGTTKPQRAGRRARQRVDVANLTFPSSDQPRVSIVIPTYKGYGLTLRCLAALSRNTTGPYEVIVVDDASPDETASRLSSVPGLHVLSNPRNMGFTDSVIAGAGAARGEFLMFLNNDTEVQAGWLPPLLEAMEADPTIGAAGSKLVFPDGRLQEVGSVIWNDATGANLGYGADPRRAEFNYLRDVDYCSAAALMVRRSCYEEVGGFDRTFAPGYYEDTDLCFAIRAEGHRVVCVPDSVVVHAHGSSFGSEEGRMAIGPFTKDAMNVNRIRFAIKWSAELEDHWPSGTAGGFLGGRRDHRPRILVCDYQVPTHDRDSGGLRMRWIIRLLVRAGCMVSLLPLNRLAPEPYTQDFQRLGVEVLYGRDDIRSVLQARAGIYDIAFISRPEVADQLLDMIRAASPRTFVVYDTVDLHHVREARRLQLNGSEPDSSFVEIRAIERRLIRRSDLVATVSAEEEEAVHALAAETSTIVLPNVHESISGELPGFEERSGLLFIGGFHHPPNVDAMIWFVEEILPIIRRQAQAHLTILGADPSPEVRALAGEGITVTGYVPEVDQYFQQARVFVAPLRYGAGVKGKVGQAMAYGVPVVTTTIGAEGMGIVDGDHALVRDEPAAFAEAVQEVLSSAQKWSELSNSGRDLVHRFSPEAMSDRLQEMMRRAHEDGHLKIGRPSA